MTLRPLALLSAVPGFSALTVAAAGRPSVALPLAADIPAASPLGSRLLASSRHLDGNDNFSWIAGYSLQFEKCGTSEEYYGGYFGGGENNDNNNNQNNYNGMYQQRLVHYKLCPTGSCETCSGGAEYVIDMGLFVEAFIESKLEAQEYACEQVKENCYYDDEYQCYAAAGLDYCMDDENDNENDNGQMEFNLEEAAECQELDVDDEALQWYYYQQQQDGNGNQQNYNYNQNGGQDQELALFVGPYCSADGQSIFLGVFMDEMCSYPAADGTYEKFSYGQALPYASESLIDGDCLSCREPQDDEDGQNGDDQEDEDEVREVCERLYEDAGKCESGLDAGVTYYPNTYACDFIQTLQAPGKTAREPVAASTVLAGLFAVTSVVLGGVAYVFYSKAQRNNVNLSSRGEGTLA